MRCYISIAAVLSDPVVIHMPARKTSVAQLGCIEERYPQEPLTFSPHRDNPYIPLQRDQASCLHQYRFWPN